MRLPRGLLETGVEKYLPCLVRIMTLLWSCMDQAGPKLQVRPQSTILTLTTCLRMMLTTPLMLVILLTPLTHLRPRPRSLECQTNLRRTGER